MADLASLQSGVSVQGYKTTPLNLGQEPPAALPPDTSKLSNAQAHAALMGTVSQTLSQLPSLILNNYVQGRKVGQQMKADSALTDVLGGKAPNLPIGTTIGPDGITYKSAGPNAAALADVELSDKRADVALKGAKTVEALDKARYHGLEPNPLADSFAPVPPLAGSDYGKVTTYGDKKDPFGGPKAISSTIGPDGKPLPPDSLGVSPDVEETLAKSGIKMGDKVQIQLSNGQTVTRTLADRTAQDADILAGKFKQYGLDKPLRGRWDFRSTDGSLNANSDARVVGFSKVGAPAAPVSGGVLSSVETNAPLPTDPVQPAIDWRASASPAPALSAQNATQAQGALEQPTSDPATSAAPVQAPVENPGDINIEEAAKASGGQKLTDSGHIGGVVTRYKGFDKEETADGTIQIYPHYAKPGAKPIVLRKPMNYSAGTDKLISESAYQPKPGESEASVAANARQKLMDNNKLPPEIRPFFMRWENSLPKNEVVHKYNVARETVHNTEAAFKEGLTPAAALAVIDSFVKAMRGGAATQGMTRILEEAQPIRSRLELLYKRITGTKDENAVLSQDMADDVKHILGRIKDAAQKDVEAMRDGEVERWSDDGVPEGRVKKAFAPILTGTNKLLNNDFLSEPSAAGTTPAAGPAKSATPQEAMQRTAETAKAVKAKYDSGGYTGEDKTRAEALLKQAGLL